MVQLFNANGSALHGVSFSCFFMVPSDENATNRRLQYLHLLLESFLELVGGNPQDATNLTDL
jgi:hypothetical protein